MRAVVVVVLLAALAGCGRLHFTRHEVVERDADPSIDARSEAGSDGGPGSDRDVRDDVTIADVDAADDAADADDADADVVDASTAECGSGLPACDDGDACTIDRCTDGACTTAPLCTDADPDDCFDVVCGGGSCSVQPRASGATCGATGTGQCCGGGCVDVSRSATHCGGCDAPCGGGTSCIGGSCRACSGPADCDDGRGCTSDTCDTGVCNSTLTSGCIISLMCVPAGAQAPGNPCLRCDPMVANDAYSPAVGATCDDGDACTSGDVCSAAGACSGTAASCDECAAGTDGCAADATCTDTAMSYSCACNAGFTGDGFTCADIDECATGNGGCDVNARCTNTPGSRTCACNAGYTGDGLTCTDLGACATEPAAFLNDASTLARFEFNCGMVDESGNGRDATPFGTPTFATSRFGSGLVLPDTDPQGMDWSAYASLLRHPFTIEIAITPTDTTMFGKIFGAVDTTDDGWYFYMQAIGIYPLYYFGAGRAQADQYQYLAFVSTNNTRMNIYHNGTLLGTTQLSFMAPPTAAIFFRDDTATVRNERVGGVVDAVRISSVARTGTEITSQWMRLQSGPP